MKGRKAAYNVDRILRLNIRNATGIYGRLRMGYEKVGDVAGGKAYRVGRGDQGKPRDGVHSLELNTGLRTVVRKICRRRGLRWRR
jgi:hypothetical protein